MTPGRMTAWAANPSPRKRVVASTCPAVSVASTAPWRTPGTCGENVTVTVQFIGAVPLQAGICRANSVALTDEKLGADSNPVNWYASVADGGVLPCTAMDPRSWKAGPIAARTASGNGN